MSVNIAEIGKSTPNGTVLLMGISFTREDAPDPDATRGMTAPRVFTYALLKVGGLWYVTGSGKAPTAAGWPAVLRWLGKDGRKVEWIDRLTGAQRIWPVPLPEPVDVYATLDTLKPRR